MGSKTAHNYESLPRPKMCLQDLCFYLAVKLQPNSIVYGKAPIGFGGYPSQMWNSFSPLNTSMDASFIGLSNKIIAVNEQ